MTKHPARVHQNHVIVGTMAFIANLRVPIIVPTTYAGLITDIVTTARMDSMANTATYRVPTIVRHVKTFTTAPGAKMVGTGMGVVTNARITAYHAAQIKLATDAFSAGSVIHVTRNVRVVVVTGFVEKRTAHVYKIFVNLDSSAINVIIRVCRTAYPALTQTVVTYVKTDGTAATVVTHALSTVYRVVQTPL